MDHVLISAFPLGNPNATRDSTCVHNLCPQSSTTNNLVNGQRPSPPNLNVVGKVHMLHRNYIIVTPVNLWSMGVFTILYCAP